MPIQIGQLAKQTDTSVEAIRFYEKEGLMLKPIRSSGNYRLYTQEHIERLKFIRHCRMLDMTLNDVHTLLRFQSNPKANCTEVNQLLDNHIEAVNVRLDELLQLKQHLLRLREKCQGDDTTSSCGILQALSDASCHKQ